MSISYCFIVILLKHQVTTILNVCKIIHNIYEMVGFLLQVMKMDSKFDPLCTNLEQIQIHLNDNGEINHVPEA